MEELWQVPPKRNDETTGLIRGHSRAHNSRSDSDCMVWMTIFLQKQLIIFLVKQKREAK